MDCEANHINHGNDNLISNAEITSIQCDEVAGGGAQNHHSGANGSLITMTMKNNHLIVETEERSVSIAQLEHSSNVRDPFIFIVSIPYSLHNFCTENYERNFCDRVSQQLLTNGRKRVKRKKGEQNGGEMGKNHLNNEIFHTIFFRQHCSAKPASEILNTL